ncbi:MAG: RibD family protein [Bacteroidales bacterium]|nr:MAG: RibD family protein [Bacteroidales bacterium]
MIPEVIIHNAISLDGSVTGFEPDIGTYYQLALGFTPDILLVGSDTITSAPDEIPPEKESDFEKPEIAANDNRPLWVIPDSRGKLKGILHFYRSMEYIKDIVILISKKTPRSYINYLNERQYDLVSAGDDHVDYKKALEILYDMYHSRTIVTDSGGTLNNILIEKGLVSKISLLISPILTGAKNPALFRSLQVKKSMHKLRLLKSETLENDQLWLQYKLLKLS